MNFKLVISDPKGKHAYNKEVEQSSSGLIGKRIGEVVSGDQMGLEGYKLEVTGGSDTQGFPMRRDVAGQVRKRILLSSPPGFHPVYKGQRKRRSIRGNIVSADIAQVNIKIIEHGKKPLGELFVAKAKEGKKPAEEKAQPKEEKHAKAEEAAEKPKAEEKHAEAKPAEQKPAAEKK